MIAPVCFRKTELPKKATRLSLGLLLLASLGLFGACQKSEPHANNANTSTGQVASSPTTAPTASPAEVKSEGSTTPDTISLATPTDTYKTAYAARKNKDLATLKRVFTKDVLEFLTEMSVAEKKTLDDALKELFDKPQADTAETRNEKINGNRATLEYLDEKGKWTVMDFSKNGSEWKIDLPKGQ